jgi:hypothetical protein
MTRVSAPVLTLLLLGSGPSAHAASFSFLRGSIGVEGYVDVRIVLPDDQKSWIDGGMGKLRYGDPDQTPKLRLGEALAEVTWNINGELMALAVVRHTPEQDDFLGTTEAYLRYRPISLTPFRWQVKAGAFFPPISLENTEIGWQSPWTVTPSAINTWVGEELRTIGAEARADWRMEARTLSAFGSLYGWNDPTGILFRAKGWGFHDWITGLADHPRVPDAYAVQSREDVPYHTAEFIEIDNRVGWYVGGAWDETGLGRIEVLRYDNQADPDATTSQTAWQTEFWSVGASTNIMGLTILAQWMDGMTFFIPSPGRDSRTEFESAFILAGWERGNWRLAGRYEIFNTEEFRSPTTIYLSEHGNAFTVAANWLPNDWMRITAEWIRIHSTRNQRLRENIDPKQIETQGQVSMKVYF